MLNPSLIRLGFKEDYTKEEYYFNIDGRLTIIYDNALEEWYIVVDSERIRFYPLYVHDVEFIVNMLSNNQPEKLL
jgi:hypothetical protein